MPGSDTDRYYKIAFQLFLLLVLAGMWVLVLHYGSSGDEPARFAYGKRVLEYYTGIPSAGNYPLVAGTYYQPYGGLFDMSVSYLMHLFQPKDQYLFRHYWNALFGFLGIVFAGLTAREITGRWRTALLTSFLLLITPRYFGDSFNNPKDIPFAAATLVFTYALFRWMKQVKAPQWKTTLFLGLSLLLGLGIRPGGLLFFFYFTVIALAGYWYYALPFRRIAPHVLVALAIGYFGCALCWPMFNLSPVLYPFLSFKSQTKLLVIGHVLFEGKMLPCRYLPWYYAHKMIFITTPIIVLVGMAASLVSLVRSKQINRTYLLLLWLFIAMPLFFIVVRHSVFYDGIRHILFLVALLVVVSGVGIDALLSTLHPALLKGCAAVLLLAMTFHPIANMLRNHPYEYVYYNETVGGLKGAYTNYETDYYMTSVKQAFDWLKQQEAVGIHTAKDSLTLISDCEGQLIYNYNAAAHLPLRIVEGSFSMQNAVNWDYAIFITRFLDKKMLRSGYFPSAKVIYQVTADGVPLCVVLKNDPGRDGFKAWHCYTNKDYAGCIAYAQQCLARYPKDITTWSLLAEVYLKTGALEEAQQAIDKAMALSDINLHVTHYAGEIAFRKRDIPNALRIFTKTTQEYPMLPDQWLGLARAQAMAGKVITAQQTLAKAAVMDNPDKALLCTALAEIAHAQHDVVRENYFVQLSGFFQR